MSLGVPVVKAKVLPFRNWSGRGLAVVFHQLGLVVKNIEVRWTARHVEIDHSLGLGLKMGLKMGGVGRKRMHHRRVCLCVLAKQCLRSNGRQD